MGQRAARSVVAETGSEMPKGEQRSNREVKKPKQSKKTAISQPRPVQGTPPEDFGVERFDEEEVGARRM